MFKSKKELIISDAINIQNMDHLNVLKSSVAKTAQTDFGLSWNSETAEQDDEKAFAMAIAFVYELGGQIVSKDEQVLQYVRELRTKQSSREFF